MATKSPPGLQEFLDDATFPVAKSELVRRGRDEGLKPDMVAILDQLPDETYMTSVDVSLAVADVETTQSEERRRRAGTSPATQSRPRKAASAKPEPNAAETPKAMAQSAASRLTARATDVAKTQLESRKGDVTAQLSQAAQSIRQSSQQFRDQGNAQLADISEVAASGLEKANEFLGTRDVDAILRDAEATIRRQRVVVIGGAFAAAFLVTRALKAGMAEPQRSDEPKKQNER